MTVSTVSLSAVAQSGRAVEAAARGGAATGERSARAAEALQYLGPFPAYACLLHNSEKPSLTVLDDTGSPRQDWATSLMGLLRQWTLEAKSGCVSSAPPADVPGECLFGAPLEFEGRRYGVLAIAAPHAGADDLRTALGLVAARLAAQLYFAEDCGGSGEAQRIQWLDNVAETTSIVSHEFNNFLNGIMLHLALLKQEAPKSLSAELDVMKRLAMDAAGLVKKLQEFNGGRRPELTPTDLNDAVRDVLEQKPLPAGVARVIYDFADNLPAVDAARRELGRLLDMLLRQAGAAMQDKPGTLTLRTQAAPRKVVLRFEDTGPALKEEALAKVFEPFFIARPGVEPPGLALCQTLSRRLRASIRAENSSAGGVAFVLEFTPAAPATSA